MAVRRKDARRRRLVIDPTAQMGDVEAGASSTPAVPRRRKKPVAIEARTYTFGADRRNQRKTTDLIPKRVVSCLFVVVGLLSFLWLINFTSVNSHRWSDNIGQAGLEAFAIGGQGSLASWFLSFLLIMTALASLQIYALRKHRCDDYRGTYRIWVWTAGLLVLASINCVSDLGAVLTNLARSLTGGSFVLRAWVPVAFQLVAMGLLLGRGVYEVRQSRGSLSLVVFVWIAYSAAAVLHLPVIEQSLVGLGAETIIGNCVLFGTTALFLAHLTYARYIFLDAHGLIDQRVAKAKKSKAKASIKTPVAKKTKKAKVQRTKTGPTKSSSKKSDSPAEISAPSPVAKSTAAKPRPAAKPNSKKPVKTKGTADSQPDIKQAPKDKSPSDVLKELAAASRAKEQTQQSAKSQPSDDSHFDDHEEHEGVISMSKSQRRKRRKMEKQRRRAA